MKLILTDMKERKIVIEKRHAVDEKRLGLVVAKERREEAHMKSMMELDRKRIMLDERKTVPDEQLFEAEKTCARKIKRNKKQIRKRKKSMIALLGVLAQKRA